LRKSRKGPSVLLIYTGGTIGMIHDPRNGELKPFNFNALTEHIPELNRFDLRLETVSFRKPLDSSNMRPEIIAEIARIISDQYSKFDGFVVLHGSDTMSYTASALSFMLEGLAKPVILTGSQLPIGTIRTDGKENLITAIEIASAQENGKPVVTEVCIYFEYKLYRGNRTTKYNSRHFDAFVSPNYPLLAEAGVTISYSREFLRRPPSSKRIQVHTRLDNQIAVLKLFPGISAGFVKGVLSIPGLKALILETFGAGNASTEKWFLDALRSALGKGIVILNITQCPEGRVEQGLYETSASLKRMGVTGGADLTFESAVTKLMFLLGAGYSGQKLKKLLVSDLRGEITP
jgi:L-asparaginase